MVSHYRKSLLSEVFEATPHLLNYPKNKLWIDYDEEADVLYPSFQRPQKGTDSEMRDDGVLFRYKRDKFSGVKFDRRIGQKLG